MMFRLMVAEIENEDEYGDGGDQVTRDCYFGSLEEILSRLCYPWLKDAIAFGVYQKQSDGSWLLYYHSI